MTMPTAESEGVEVYVDDPDRLGIIEPVEWPGTGSFAERGTVNGACVTWLG